MFCTENFVLNITGFHTLNTFFPEYPLLKWKCLLCCQISNVSLEIFFPCVNFSELKQKKTQSLYLSCHFLHQTWTKTSDSTLQNTKTLANIFIFLLLIESEILTASKRRILWAALYLNGRHAKIVRLPDWLLPALFGSFD